MIEVPEYVIEAREGECRRCKTPCIRKGSIDFTDAAEACHIERWPCYASGCIETPRAPMLPVMPSAAAPPVRGNRSGIQPGDVFAIIIKDITGVKSCTPCDYRRTQMNDWGWGGCLKNRSTIINWLLSEAKMRGHKISRYKALSLFVAAAKEITAKRGGQ